MSFPESRQVASHLDLRRALARHHGPPFGPLPEGGDLFLPGHRERFGGLELLDEELGREVGAVGEGGVESRDDGRFDLCPAEPL